ncbi:MAG: cytidylate kinase, partial [Treponemataceae bacterium]|nr:cytidylate kinase [Treponemataceae bacterium]
LIASDDTRAKRILNREGGDLQQIKDFTAMRDREDSARYLKLYGIDNDEYEFADLKIDTATRTPEQVVSLIIDYLEKNGRVVRK